MTLWMGIHVLAAQVTLERIARQVTVWDCQTHIHAYYETFNESVYLYYNYP